MRFFLAGEEEEEEEEVWTNKKKLMSDPAIKLFGKTIPLPELGGDSSVTGVSTENQEQNLVRLSDSSTGDDEDMGDSGLGGGDGGGFRGGDNESGKVSFFFGLANRFVSRFRWKVHLFNGNDLMGLMSDWSKS